MVILLLLSCGPSLTALHLPGSPLEAELGEQWIFARSSEGE